MVRLEVVFPKLTSTAYEITSIATQDYNCIAWAAGDSSHWWEPYPDFQYFWPEGVLRQYTVRAYVEAFLNLGFEIGQDFKLEKGIEKVAIFANPGATPTHAARQLVDGTWTSKLGQDVDIRHIELDHVSGELYGNPILILQRRRIDS